MSTSLYILAGLFAVVFVIAWGVLAYKLYRVVSAGSDKGDSEEPE